MSPSLSILCNKSNTQKRRPTEEHEPGNMETEIEKQNIECPVNRAGFVSLRRATDRQTDRDRQIQTDS